MADSASNSHGLTSSQCPQLSRTLFHHAPWLLGPFQLPQLSSRRKGRTTCAPPVSPMVAFMWLGHSRCSVNNMGLDLIWSRVKTTRSGRQGVARSWGSQRLS